MVSLFKHSFVLISMQLLVHAADFKEHEFILQKWNSFKIQFNKRYESAEEDRFRMKIFLTNEDEIAKHNERFEKGEVSYEKEMTKFGDLTPEEFAQLYSTDADPISIPSPHIVTSLPPILGDPPESKNWVAEGAVTSVKNQGSCDSCWAFAAAGAIESHYFIKYGKLIPLSAQNLMDCVGNTEKSNNDCCGGQMRSAFDYVKNRGIATEEVYPYTDKESICEKKVSENEKITIKNIGRPYPFQNWVKINKRECKINLSKSSTFTIKNYTRLLHKNEEELKRIVGLTGPVTASINSHGLFEYYEQGMIWNDDYCTNELGKNDHGVLIVGYGTDAGEDYWLVKNSWGVDWGDKGYFRIARGPYNTCGIANYNYYPII